MRTLLVAAVTVVTAFLPLAAQAQSEDEMLDNIVLLMTGLHDGLKLNSGGVETTITKVSSGVYEMTWDGKSASLSAERVGPCYFDLTTSDGQNRSMMTVNASLLDVVRFTDNGEAGGGNRRFEFNFSALPGFVSKSPAEPPFSGVLNVVSGKTKAELRQAADALQTACPAVP